MKASQGILVLTSGNRTEESLLQQIVSSTEQGTNIEYNGRSGDEKVELHFKLGEDRITLRSHTKKDQERIRTLRNGLFFSAGGSGLIVLRHSTIRGKLAVEVCVAKCLDCGAPVTRMENTGYLRCEPCIKKCPCQTFVRGAVSRGSFNSLAMSEYCPRCGRVKPDAKIEPIKEVPELGISTGESTFRFKPIPA